MDAQTISVPPQPTQPLQVNPLQPEEVVRQTEHTAVLQPGDPQVSYEAENYQPPVDTYTPPAITTMPPLIEPPQLASTPAEPIIAANESVEPTIDPVESTATRRSRTTAEPEESRYFPGVTKPLPEEVVLEWQALSRPYKKYTHQYFRSIIVIAVLLSFIFVVIGQSPLIAVVAAFVFFKYVTAVIPPTRITFKLTTYGIKIEDTLYFWEELGRFWFTEKYGQHILHVEVARFPWRLTVMMGDLTEEDLTEVLSEVLLKEKPKPTALEKGATWLQEKFPLD